MKSNKIKQRFIELRACGHSFDNIAKQLEVAKSTLIDWSKEFDYDIANLKAIEMESLQEQYYVAKRGRVEIIGEQTKKLNEELLQRELTDIPTEKLHDLFLKYMHWLKQEEVETVFHRQKEEDVEDIIKNTLTNVERWKAN